MDMHSGLWRIRAALKKMGAEPFREFVDYGEWTQDPKRRKRKADEDYRGGHQPPPNAPPIHDLTQGGTFPGNVYEYLHEYIYGHDEGARESYDIVQQVQGQPDALVQIFRAAPANVTAINTGDWIAVAYDYAKLHSRDQEDESLDWPVLQATVSAHQIRNGGNDLVEWGYWGPSLEGEVVQ